MCMNNEKAEISNAGAKEHLDEQPCGECVSDDYSTLLKTAGAKGNCQDLSPEEMRNYLYDLQ